MKRRNFIQSATATSIGLGTGFFPMMARAAAPHVVVVGGGMAGATVAKYLRLWSLSGINVTLIEKDSVYTSNIMSNEVLTGKRSSVSTLNYAYDAYATKYGITRIQGEVKSINGVGKSITYRPSGGSDTTLTYDRLVLAPGLDFDLMPGMSSLAQYDSDIPHAWKAGSQTTTLRNQLLAMSNGANVVITIPLAPYRCPPGPYERACVIADWLLLNKPASKVVVLDENASIQAEATNFTNAFNGAYGYRVDYRPNSLVSNIDVPNKIVSYNSTSIAAGVLNPIPPQRAPKLLLDAGLLDGGKFAPVNLLTFESKVTAGIHIIGDACNSGVPKAGHIGNQEAKTCANAIVNAILGNSYALNETSPVLNSACFTPVTSTMATWLSAVYQYNSGTGLYGASTQNSVSQPKAATTASTDNYSEMNTWFKTLMSDTLG